MTLEATSPSLSTAAFTSDVWSHWLDSTRTRHLLSPKGSGGSPPEMRFRLSSLAGDAYLLSPVDSVDLLFEWLHNYSAFCLSSFFYHHKFSPASMSQLGKKSRFQRDRASTCGRDLFSSATSSSDPHTLSHYRGHRKACVFWATSSAGSGYSQRIYSNPPLLQQKSLIYVIGQRELKDTAQACPP
ncbi:hypothetical protein Btru_041612 [Bulinus truncatus]|nr:hypothetical protein Btru_041612 [Bulinus truncatus]